MTAETPRSADTVRMDERLEAIFERFGWELTEEFKARYFTDVWIYYLANGLVALADEVESLRRQFDGSGA